jgi:hypothetical protein
LPGLLVPVADAADGQLSQCVESPLPLRFSDRGDTKETKKNEKFFSKGLF